MNFLWIGCVENPISFAVVRNDGNTNAMLASLKLIKDQVLEVFQGIIIRRRWKATISGILERPCDHVPTLVLLRTNVAFETVANSYENRQAISPNAFVERPVIFDFSRNIHLFLR
jgi:hypothetical protein